MKKNIITIALAAIALITSSTVFAQQNENNKQKGDKKKIENREERKMEHRQIANPFEGLNLTEKQQNSLKALAEEQQKAFKQQKENKKADRDKEKKDRKDAMKNGRKEYLAKIKGILTADQYTQFLENNYINQSKDFKKGGKDKFFKGKGKMKGKMANGKQNSKNGKRGEKKTSRTDKQA